MLIRPTEKLHERYFQDNDVKDDLAGRSLRGGAITVISQSLKFILTMGSAVILARLLSPDDYGIIAMVMAVTGFVRVFGDFGLSMATLQKEDITCLQLSTLFWLNVATGVLLAVVTAVFSPLVAWFYGETRLTLVTIALSAGFFITGLSIQHQTILRRRMKFKLLAIAEVSSVFLGVVVAIGCALNGFGYWALVIQQLTGGLISLGVVWVGCAWRPGLPDLSCGVRPLISFGGNLTGFNFINYIVRNLDNILIGWFCGARDLGLYSRAYSLLMLPLNQINAPLAAVSVPVLSRLQDQPDRFKRYYLKSVFLISLVTFPMIMFFIVMSQEIIELVLGGQWKDAGTIYKYLAVAALFQPLCNTAGWVYVALGRSLLLLRWGVYSSVVIILAFCVGVIYGPLGVSIAYSVAIIVLVVPCMYMATKYTSITLSDIYKKTSAVFFISIICAMASVLVFSIVSNIVSSSMLKVGIVLSFMILSYACVCLSRPLIVAEIKEIFASRKLL